MGEGEARKDIGKLLDAVREATAVQMLPDPRFPGVKNCSGCGSGNLGEQPVIHRPNCPTVTLGKLCAGMTAKYQTAVLACPFCGDPHAAAYLKGSTFYCVLCHHCGAGGPPRETESGAVGGWNHRPSHRP